MNLFSCRAFILNLIILLLLGNTAFVSGEGRIFESSDETDNFQIFAADAAGRFYTEDYEDIIVLELIPAFGKLFASVGRYLHGESLYSYYTAQLLPVCSDNAESCHSSHSRDMFDVNVRFFSNMSMGGNYWSGETIQRLTVFPGGLMISDYQGDGDGLVSKENILLSRSDAVPSMFPYGPAEAEKIHGIGSKSEIPEKLTGSWMTSWLSENTRTSVQLSIKPDGMMYLLRQQDIDYPPLFLKGGFVVSEGESDSFELCYLLNSPASGTMPYTGCVMLIADGAFITAERSLAEEDDLLLSSDEDVTRYERN